VWCIGTLPLSCACCWRNGTQRPSPVTTTHSVPAFKFFWATSHKPAQYGEQQQNDIWVTSLQKTNSMGQHSIIIISCATLHKQGETIPNNFLLTSCCGISHHNTLVWEPFIMANALSLHFLAISPGWRCREYYLGFDTSYWRNGTTRHAPSDLYSLASGFGHTTHKVHRCRCANTYQLSD